MVSVEQTGSTQLYACLLYPVRVFVGSLVHSRQARYIHAARRQKPPGLLRTPDCHFCQRCVLETFPRPLERWWEKIEDDLSSNALL